MPEFTLTAHAETVIAARSIRHEWVSRVLDAPRRVDQDATDPELKHALGPIEEQGGKVLRVVYSDSVRPVRIITAYFDRSLKGKL